jgi:hypothetical protein
LTFLGKVVKKAFVKRARRRGYLMKGTKRQYPTDEEGLDGCRMEPVFQEKE